MVDRTIAVKLTADIATFERNMRRAAQTTSQVGRDILTTAERSAESFNTLGLAMGGAGAVGALALRQIAGEAIAFESAWAGVTKTVNGTEQQLSALSDGLRQMALRDVPVSVNALADIAASAGQLGVRTESIEGFTRVIADLGVATNLSGEQAATALARLANITQMPQESFDRLGSTVVALGNNLATTEAEIVEMGLRLAGAGAQIGLTEADILALAGALSSVGIEAEAGGTAFSRVMVDIAQAASEGGEKLDLFAEVAGMSATDFATAFQTDPAAAIVAFVGGLGRISDAGGDTFGVLEDLELGEIRVRDALLRSAGAGELMADAIDLSSRAWEENTALVEEAEQRYATTESQIQFARNALADLGIELGENLLPLVGALAGGVADLAGFFADLPEPVQSLALLFGGLATTLGLVGGSALLLLPRFFDLKRELNAVGITAGTTRSALLSLNTVKFAGIGLAIGGITHLFIEAGAAARSFADDVEESAGDSTVDRLSALNDELDRARARRGGTLDRIELAFTNPAETLRQIRIVEELDDRIGDLRGTIEEAAFEGRSFANHQEALNHYLAEGYDYTTALGLASMEMAQNVAQGARAADGWTQRTIAANEAMGTFTAATGDYRQALAGAGADTAAFGQGIETNVRLPLESLPRTIEDLIQPLEAWNTARDLARDAARTWAEGEVEAGRMAADAVAGFVESATGSATEWIDQLEDQQQAQQEWADNMTVLAGRVSQETLDELTRLGPEGAVLVADLVDESDAELDRLDDVMIARTDDAIGAMEDRIQGAREVAARFGQQTVDAMTDRLRSGTATVSQIAAQYALALATGVNPILLALGKRSITSANGISVPADYGALGMNSGGQVPGGYGTRDTVPAMLTTGEFVEPAERVREPGALQFLETMRRGGFEAALHERMYAHPAHYNAGGFVSAADVPGVPSVSPYRSYVGEPASATMGAGRSAVLDFLSEAAASGGLPVGAGQIAELLWRTAGHFNHMHLASRDNTWLVAVGRKLQGMGARVAEHPAFGGVRGRHAPNSYHYSGQAIDANYGPGGENAIEKAFFDRVVPQIRAGTFDQGGTLMPGLTLAYNGTGGPEMVVGPNGSADVNIVGFSSTAAQDIAAGMLPSGVPEMGADPIAAMVAQMSPDEIRALTEEIAANREMLRIEGLDPAARLAEVRDEMSRTVENSDAWVRLLREAQQLEQQIAQDAEVVAQEVERQVRAQEDAAEAASRQADQLGDDLIRLLDQRDRLQEQAANAVRDHATAVADAQTRAAREVNDLTRARQDALFGAFGSVDQRFAVGWGNLTSQYADELDRRFELFDEWADGVQALRDRGVSEDVIAQLGLDDPSNLADVRLFVNATDAELQRLTDALSRNQQQTAATADREADMLLGALGTAISAVRATLQTTLDDLGADLNVRLSEIGLEMAALGTDQGRSYADALTEALASGLPGVIALAEQYQQALRDAQAAADAAAALGTNDRTDVGGSANAATHYIRPESDARATAGRTRPADSAASLALLFDSGGVWPSGTMGVNLSGRDEYVFTQEQLRSMRPSPAGGVTRLEGDVELVLESGERFNAHIKSKSREARREDAFERSGQGVVG